ncbi:MAG TPA: sigma-70 family RNA polymerase sigma factor [Acidobacteriota bacterium]|nr:sigma-70 family RNA polymerase sigma factor [Acidobacteriota bacterium]
MSERELVQRAQAGDFDAFSELLSRHKNRIYGLARRLAGNKQDAEDIVQETFLKAVDKIDQFRLESSFGTWLYSIALNESRALYASRKQVDLKPLQEYLPAGHSDGAGPEDHQLFDWHDPHQELETAELRRVIDKAIGELPYKYREAFLLRYVEELSVKEVARLIGESEAATKSRILRARLALRDFLAEVFEGSYGKTL